MSSKTGTTLDICNIFSNGYNGVKELKLIRYQGRIQDFLDGGRGGGTKKFIICPIIPEKCTKLKRFWWGGGVYASMRPI